MSLIEKFSKDTFAPPISTQIFCDKPPNIFSRDLYMPCRVNLKTDSVNPVATKFVNHGISAVDTSYKSARIWSPATITTMSPDITHWRAAKHYVGYGSEVGDVVYDKSDYSEENYKTDFEIWIENFKLQFERKNIERS